MGELVVAVAEVARLDPAFLDQRADAVVDLPEAHAHFAGEFALGKLGARFEQPQEAVVGFLHSVLGGVGAGLLRPHCVQRVNADCRRGVDGCQVGQDEILRPSASE